MYTSEIQNDHTALVRKSRRCLKKKKKEDPNGISISGVSNLKECGM